MASDPPHALPAASAEPDGSERRDFAVWLVASASPDASPPDTPPLPPETEVLDVDGVDGVPALALLVREPGAATRPVDGARRWLAGTDLVAGVATGTLGHGLAVAVAVAREGLAVALGAGGVVHSELYELIAARERVRPSEAVRAAVVLTPPSMSKTAPEPADEADDPFAHEAPRVPEGPSGRSDSERESAINRATGGAAELDALVAELERSRAEHDRDERRIAKLLRQLEELEARQAKLEAELAGDGSVASRFRSVQGLDRDDPHAEIKQRLLEGAFRADREDRSKA